MFFSFLKNICLSHSLARHPAQALSFIADVRDRLLEPDATIIPAAGCQFISCIESPDIKSITSVSGWDGIKLDGFEVSHTTTATATAVTTTTKKTKFPTTTPPPPPPVFIQRRGPWCGAMMMGCPPSPPLPDCDCQQHPFEGWCLLSATPLLFVLTCVRAIIVMTHRYDFTILVRH